MTTHPARMGQPWKDEEVLKLLTSIQKNKSFEEIAREHERTVGSIHSYRKKLAVEYHINENRPIAQIEKITGLTKEQIDDAIKKYEMRESLKAAPVEKKSKKSDDALPSLLDVMTLLKDIQQKVDFLLERASS